MLTDIFSQWGRSDWMAAIAIAISLAAVAATFWQAHIAAKAHAQSISDKLPIVDVACDGGVDGQPAWYDVRATIRNRSDREIALKSITVFGDFDRICVERSAIYGRSQASYDDAGATDTVTMWDEIDPKGGQCDSLVVGLVLRMSDDCARRARYASRAAAHSASHLARLRFVLMIDSSAAKDMQLKSILMIEP